MSLDASLALVEGPWEHRFVAANGARFHVAELGEGPTVLLLHGFPQFWWAWRHQMVALAEAGYTPVAYDNLTGDKPGIDHRAACQYSVKAAHLMLGNLKRLKGH